MKNPAPRPSPARGEGPSASNSFPPEHTAVAATVDARGTLCPIPIIWAAERMRTLAPGEVLEVLATDEAILDDLPAWCRATGHEFLGFDGGPPVYRGFARHRSA